MKIATEGWYQRIENNGWRPVSNKHLVQMNMDYYYGVQSKYETIKFEHTKVTIITFYNKVWQKKVNILNFFFRPKILRKQDVEASRKKKKIEWMKKM